MHRHDFQLPTGEIICLVTFAYHGGSVSNYVNGVRRGWIAEDSFASLDFKRLEPRMCADIVNGMTELGLDFDAILRIPSSRADADALYSACLSNWPDAKDLSSRMTRAGRIKAADATTVDSMKTELIFRADGSESEIRSLLIVDESSAAGKTVAALLEILREQGVPAGVDVTLAVYVVMKKPTEL